MKKCIVILCVLCLLSTPALALDTGAVEDAVPEGARAILGEIGVSDILAGENVFRRVWDEAVRLAAGELGRAARSAALALTAALLCSAAAAMSPDGRLPGAVLLGGCLAILGACMGDVRSFLGEAEAALSALSDFSRALLPCVAAVSAAAGSEFIRRHIPAPILAAYRARQT